MNGIDKVYKTKDFVKESKKDSLRDSKKEPVIESKPKESIIQNFIQNETRTSPKRNDIKTTPRRKSPSIRPTKDIKASTMNYKRTEIVGRSRTREKILTKSVERKSLVTEPKPLSTYPSFRPKDFRIENTQSVDKQSRDDGNYGDNASAYRNQGQRIYNINESILKNRYCKALRINHRSKSRNAPSIDSVEKKHEYLRKGKKKPVAKKNQTEHKRNKSELTNSEAFLTMETGASKKFTNILNKSAIKASSRENSRENTKRTSNTVSSKRIQEAIRQYKWNYDYCEREKKFIKISYCTSVNSPNYDWRNMMLNKFQRKFEMISQNDWLELKFN